MSKKTDQIKKSLEPLFEKAEKEGLWFYTSYQSMWFSPAELKVNLEKDKFVWGPPQWKLREPNERMEELVGELKQAATRIKAFHERMQFQNSLKKVRTCRVCGCTDLDCSQCIERTGKRCHWVEPDLCSACE